MSSHNIALPFERLKLFFGEEELAHIMPPTDDLDAATEPYRELAFRDVKAHLESRSPAILVDDLRDLSQLETAVYWRVAEMLYLNAMSAQGDKYDRRYVDATKRYAQALDALRLDTSDGEKTSGSFGVNIERR